MQLKVLTASSAIKLPPEPKILKTVDAPGAATNSNSTGKSAPCVCSNPKFNVALSTSPPVAARTSSPSQVTTPIPVRRRSSSQMQGRFSSCPSPKKFARLTPASASSAPKTNIDRGSELEIATEARSSRSSSPSALTRMSAPQLVSPSSPSRQPVTSKIGSKADSGSLYSPSSASKRDLSSPPASTGRARASGSTRDSRQEVKKAHRFLLVFIVLSPSFV